MSHINFTGIGAVWALRNGDFTYHNFTGDASGIQGALDYCAASTGGDVIAGPGTYILSSPLSIGQNTILRGCGRAATILQASPAFSGAAMVTNANQAGGMQWCSLENLTIDGNKNAGAVVALGIWFKGIGQPSRIRDVTVTSCSSIGCKLEGIGTNAGNFLVENTGIANCPLGAFWITGTTAGYTFRDIDAEFVNAGVPLIYVDGPISSLYPGTILFDGVHLEGLLSGSVGILIESARNVHVKDVVYFGSGNVGDLIKITGTATEIQNCVLENITAFLGSVANGLVDSLNGYTLANGADGVNISRYEIGSPRIAGPQRVTGALTVDGAATFGKAGTSEQVTVGQGTTGTDTAELAVNSGNSGSTQARLRLERNGVTELFAIVNGTAVLLQHDNPIHFDNLSGVGHAQLDASGRLRLGDAANPVHRLELIAGTTTIAPIKLTAGTNLTTPVDGCLEFDGTNLYITIGGVRKTITVT